MTIYERLVSAFASDICEYCHRPGPSVCGDCLLSISPFRSSRCGLCNTITLDYRVCTNCRRSTALHSLIIASDYDNELKEILRRFKFERQRQLAEPLAQLLEPLITLQFDVVTHVPTAGRRRRRRGYDQAELLAQGLAALLVIDHRPLLLRVGSERQVGHSRKERQRLAVRQFGLGAPVDTAENKRILIVDDIVTTGSTLSAAANVLKQAKPRQIVGIAAAK